MNKYIKNILFAIALFYSGIALGQTKVGETKSNMGSNIIDLEFSDFSRDPQNTLFTMGKEMLKGINDKNGWSNNKTGKIARSVKSYKVLTIKRDNQAASIKLLQDIDTRIQKHGEYQEYMRESGERHSIIYIRGSSPNLLSEIVIVYLRNGTLRLSSFAGENLDIKAMY